MTATYQAGSVCYELVEDWAKLPDGWTLGDVGGVAVDDRDNVYIFHRGEHPLIVLDRDGAILRSWGEDLFTRPHGIHIGADGFVYCTDDGDHTVRKLTPDGRVVMTLGVPGRPSEPMSGAPFNRCTHTALSPTGEIYVSDGYANAAVHKFSPAGRLLMSWGHSGTDPGAFNIPHNIVCDGDGWVYVADRENHRVQVFGGDGGFEAQWNNLHRPCALCMHGREPLFYVGEAGPGLGVNRDHPGLGPRVSMLSREGRLVSRFGDGGYGQRPDQFVAPHGIAVDSHGDIYVGEVANIAWQGTFPERPLNGPLRTFRKLRRLTPPR